MSKFSEILDSVALIIIVLVIAQGIDWLLGVFMASWSPEVKMFISIAIAVVLVISGVAKSYNSQDKKGN